MATQAPPRSSTAKPKAKANPRSSGGALTKDWHGLPTWAWVGIGAVSVAGIYVFVRGYRKAAASKTSSTTDQPTAGNTALPDLPALPDTNPGTYAPPTGLPSTPALPPLPAPAGTIGATFTDQQVTDIFHRYGFTSPAAIQRATVGPSGETAAERIARITRELNRGDRSLADVTHSISMLPGAAGQPRAA